MFALSENMQGWSAILESLAARLSMFDPVCFMAAVNLVSHASVPPHKQVPRCSEVVTAADLAA